MANFTVGVRHGAADAAQLAAAGLVVNKTSAAGYGGQLDPQRHYVIVQAEDEDQAKAGVAKALGWNERDAADLVARPS
jgi:hypothetical protein